MMFQDKRQWDDSDYEQYGQLGNWRSLRLMANAIRYGFAANLMPVPGSPINIEEAKKRAKSVEGLWAKEQERRDKDRVFSPAPSFSKCTTNFQCFLHQVLHSEVEKPLATNIEEYYP